MHLIRFFVEVHGLNPLSGYCTNGLSLYAAWSLMQELNQQAGTNFTRVGIIQHEYHAKLGEYLKRSYDLERSPEPMPMTGERLANARLSLYFLAENEDYSDEHLERVNNELPGLRFQGGTVVVLQPLKAQVLFDLTTAELRGQMLEWETKSKGLRPAASSKNPFAALFLKSTKVVDPGKLEDWAQAIVQGDLVVPVGYTRNLETQKEASLAFGLDVVAVEPVFKLITPMKHYKLKAYDEDTDGDLVDRFFFTYNRTEDPTLHVVV